MNIPVGKIEEQHVKFSEKEPFSRVRALLQSGFDGYLVATVEGVSGLEEGLVLLRGNEIVGSVFDALRINKQFYGASALRLVFNLLKSKRGIFDINALSRQQIDLIIAFNEKIRLPKPVGQGMLSKLEPTAYSPDFVSTELAVDLDASDSRYNLLKKLGLGSI